MRQFQIYHQYASPGFRMGLPRVYGGLGPFFSSALWWNVCQLVASKGLLETFCHNGIEEPSQGWQLQDAEGEEQDPDKVYEIPGLDEAAIDAWWMSFKDSHDYILASQNCSTTVKDALKAGGAWTKLTAEQQEEFDDISVWTPKDVDNLCSALTEWLA